QDQKSWLGRQCTRQFDAFLQPQRDNLDWFVTHAFQLKQVNDFLDLDAVLDFLALGPKQIEQGRHSAGMHEDVAAQQDVVEHAHPFKQSHVLKRTGDTALRDSMRLDSVERLAFEGNGSLLGWIETGNGVNQSRLTRT